jgi:electron transport complex protein RnfG
MEGKKSNFFVQAWLVLVLAMLYGAALAGVHMQFSPKIEENKINETRQKVPELVLGEAQAKAVAAGTLKLNADQSMITVDQGNGRTIAYSVFRASEDGQTKGWVAKASAQGYADKVELLIGMSPKADKITGLFILDQKETPGLGARIVEPSWRGQFIGKSTAHPFQAVKHKADKPYEIDAVTGATISSKTVCGIVNKTVADLKQPLAERLSGAGPAQQ